MLTIKKNYLYACISFIHLSALELTSTKLSTIDLSNCQLVKIASDDNHARKVYYKDGFFIKVWTPNFWRAPHFLNGIQSGFYDEHNTPIVSLIYDDEHMCRGYITRAGTDPNILQNKSALLPLNEQINPAYISFYYDLLNRTKAYRLAYVDLTPFNIVLQDNKIKIVDLEPILPLDNVDDNFFGCSIYPDDYKETIQQLIGDKRTISREYEVRTKTTLYLYYENGN